MIQQQVLNENAEEKLKLFEQQLEERLRGTWKVIDAIDQPNSDDSFLKFCAERVLSQFEYSYVRHCE